MLQHRLPKLALRPVRLVSLARRCQHIVAASRPALLLCLWVCGAVATSAIVHAQTPGQPTSMGPVARPTDNEVLVDLPTAIQLAERHAPELLGPQAEVAGLS